MKIVILNTAILTAFGICSHYPVSLEEAKKMVNECEVMESAVGHSGTCEVLTRLLGVTVPMNRIEYKQQLGDTALVFKIKGRIPEGKILSAEEIEEIGYGFSIIKLIEHDQFL